MKERKLRVLYVAYWGAGEPLGQSLVLPAAKKLSELGADLTLMTFEKPCDLQQHDYIESIRQDFAESEVTWVPLKYHKKPKVPATLFDIAHGCARAITLRLGDRFDIVHARTFIGGLIGLAVAPLLGAKLIYHNEGFYPDEQVDGGVWANGSTPHRVAKWLERRMYAKADAVIAMSERGRDEIEQVPEVMRKRTPVEVVPSCVDLALFSASNQADDGLIRFVYSGTVGGRYILDRLGRFVAIANELLGNVRLRVLTRAEPSLVARMLGEGGLDDGLWSVESVPFKAMPSKLVGAKAGLFFLSRGLSEHGCSPTKIGEYWAMGLPVVTTSNVSDIDDIISSERVGVVVRGHGDDDYREASMELAELLSDAGLAGRCRRAAEEHYALGPACERQYQLYLKLLKGHARGEKADIERDSQEAA